MRALVLFIIVSTFAASALADVPFRKVFTIVLENESSENAFEQPFLRKLAGQGALLAGMRGVAHPSYPNYLALTAGSTLGAGSDMQRTFDVTHIGDLLEAKGLSWKVYAEGYPGNCFLGSKSGKYARRHVPFLSYKNIQTSPERCARVVPATQLASDIAAGQLPDYMLYIPDNNDNGHDTGVGYADRYLSRVFGPLLEDPRFTRDLLFVVTFDEDDNLHGNRIYTSLWGSGVTAGARSTERYDHYSLLRTIEDAFGLGSLGREDAKASRITGVWR